MDAEREAREIVNDYRGYPDWWEQQRCYDTLELRIAAALRRAHAAGRREGFAAPVGMGGFPAGWFVGWQPLPAPPAPEDR